MPRPTKVKGLLKGGFKYISNIFEEEKEKEIEIGAPTDVKHVAHIGRDGPIETPGWMKEYKSAPLAPPEDQRQNSEIACVSEDLKRDRARATTSSRDLPDAPKPVRRHDPTDESNSKKESSGRSRHRERRHRSRPSKDSFEQSIKSGDNVPPGAPKKSRRKKSKESRHRGGLGRSRSRVAGSTSTETTSVMYSDSASETGSLWAPSSVDEEDERADIIGSKSDADDEEQEECKAAVKE